MEFAAAFREYVPRYARGGPENSRVASNESVNELIELSPSLPRHHIFPMPCLPKLLRQRYPPRPFLPPRFSPPTAVAKSIRLERGECVRSFVMYDASMKFADPRITMSRWWTTRLVKLQSGCCSARLLSEITSWLSRCRINYRRGETTFNERRIDQVA